MPAYKDKKTNQWYCSFYYLDWKGERKRKCKRGFPTKKEAQLWESEYKLTAKGDMSITLGSFVEIYFRDKEGELKERSVKNKRYMMAAHLLPYFGDKRMCDITPADIIQWQNEIRKKGFSETYLRMIQNQLTALFTHASRIYDLRDNPCKRVKKMGKSDADKMDFWTAAEYQAFIDTVEEGSMYHVLFDTLFYTGCRIGELLALTRADINFTAQQLSISKTYYRANGEDVITKPKTENSNRVIDLPKFLTDELKAYTDKLYGLQDSDRIFPIIPEAVQHKLKRHVQKAGVKYIRVHDLRHSHCADLINQGVEPLLIKERLGHKDISITLNTYGHLYPNQSRRVADLLEQRRGN